jgi:hypothetical protein
MTTKEALITIANRFEPGTMVTGPQIARWVRLYMEDHTFTYLPMESNVLRRLRETGLFEYLSPNHPDNKYHHKSMYRRKK